MIDINKAITLTLGGLNQPVTTAYQLGVIFWRLYLTGHYQGQKLVQAPEPPQKKDFEILVNHLEELGILQERKEFSKKTVFNILGKEYGSAEGVACVVDPFAYVSHLSAMDYHGLTDRIPRMLFISSPPPKEWSEFAADQMKKDIGGDISAYDQIGLPKLHRIGFSKIDRHPVNRYSSLHRGAFKSVENRSFRVSTIGRTFLDMLRKPDLCGGIYHVLDVYKESAEKYRDLIIDEIDRHGKEIDKVRAGYILEELCNLRSERLDGWQEKYVQRGGSRKLDPAGEYREVYSERWCLSLNID